MSDDGINVGAAVKVALGTGDIEKIAGHIAQASAEAVVPVEFGGNIVGTDAQRTDPASAVAFIPMTITPACPPQSWWEVRAVHVTKNGSPFLNSSSGEVVYLFASQGRDDFSSAAWRDSTALAIPQPAFYSAGQLVLYPGWSLHAAVVSPVATAATTYQIEGTALQRPYGGKTVPTIGV